MARAQKGEAPRLYSLAQLWSEQANRLDEQADELVQQQSTALSGDLRKVADQLRAASASARTMAGQAE